MAPVLRVDRPGSAGQLKRPKTDVHVERPLSAQLTRAVTTGQGERPRSAQASLERSRSAPVQVLQEVGATFHDETGRRVWAEPLRNVVLVGVDSFASQSLQWHLIMFASSSCVLHPR